MKTKKMVSGPLGFPMAEETARMIDSLLKTLPKECREYRKTRMVQTNVELSPGERADISTISTDSLDRDNEVVLPKGIDLAYFQKNPIVTLAHKYDELPVGKAQWVRKVNNQLKAKTVYAARPQDWDGPWLPDAVWSMTQEGILRGKSIGFLPTRIRPPSTEELKSRPEWKNASAVIESSVLLEYAVAPIPVNQDALVEAVAKGLADEVTLRKLGLVLPKKAIDISRLSFRIDPERIAQRVLENLKNRGRV